MDMDDAGPARRRNAIFLALLLPLGTPAFAGDSSERHERIAVSTAGAPEGMDFRAEVRKALRYLACDTIVEDVLAQGTRIEIRYSGGRMSVQFRLRERSALIFFNPRLGIRVHGRRIQSPAMMLGHELGHVYRGMRGVDERKNGRFTRAEEAAVIRRIESRIGRCAHEPVRHRYTGTPVAVSSVTLERSARPGERRFVKTGTTNTMTGPGQSDDGSDFPRSCMKCRACSSIRPPPRGHTAARPHLPARC